MTLADFLKSLVQEEIWRSVPWAPKYCVSSHGRVMGPHNVVLKPSLSNGYPHVSVSIGGANRTVRVAKLVVEAFVGPAPFQGAEIAHNDGCRTNARADNLRWASKPENQADRIRHGTRIQGSAVYGAKLSEADIPTIRARLSDGATLKVVADEFGVSPSTIHLIRKGRTWRGAGGAAWRQ